MAQTCNVCPWSSIETRDKYGSILLYTSRTDENQLRSKLESDKGDTFSGTIITDFLYGSEDGSDLTAAMDEINYYAELRRWTGQQWTDLLRKCINWNFILCYD